MIYVNSPIKQHNLSVIQADLLVAGNTIEAAKSSDNRDLLCLAGYHLVQAAEKCLKAIVKTERKDIYKTINQTHDITYIMQKAEIARHGIIAENAFLAENSEKLSAFNGMRYGLQSITLKELEILNTEVKKLADGLERDFEKAYPDKEQNAKEAKHEWDSRPKTELNLVFDELSEKELKKKIKSKPNKNKSNKNNNHNNKTKTNKNCYER